MQSQVVTAIKSAEHVAAVRNLLPVMCDLILVVANSDR